MLKSWTSWTRITVKMIGLLTRNLQQPIAKNAPENFVLLQHSKYNIFEIETKVSSIFKTNIFFNF